MNQRINENPLRQNHHNNVSEGGLPIEGRRRVRHLPAGRSEAPEQAREVSSLLFEMRHVVLGGEGLDTVEVDLEVHQGEVVALVGQHRSAVLQVMAGNLKAQRGLIHRIADGKGCDSILVDDGVASIDSVGAARLALAEATFARPNLILADEPFVLLSSIARRGMLDGLAAYRSDRSAVVIATDCPEVIELCSRTIEVGPPSRVLERSEAS